MHGAVYVEGMEDAEGDWISATRELVGPDCPISVSYDLHGNVSQRIIDAIDMFSTYRTAPHIDVEETMRRSVSMLVNSLQSGIRPGVVWAPIPWCCRASAPARKMNRPKPLRQPARD